MPVRIRTTGIDGTLREAPCWLPTYAALSMALLVCVATLYALPASEPRAEIPQARWREQLVAAQTHAFSDICAFLVQNGMEAGIEAVQETTSIILRLPEGMIFTPETERILPAGLKTLNQLGDLFLIQHQQIINIRGYTDDRPPPPGARCKDNWEISALRAAQVLRHLLAQGIEPWRLTAAGFGELEPLFPNTTEENRAKNRRVEFVLERHLGKE